MRLMRCISILVLLLTMTARASGSPERPNILLIIGDDHRTRTYGAYGATDVRTPNLDHLAAGGIRFDRAYCNSPMCTSSRQSFLTGRYPHANGVTMLRHKLSEEEVTLADRLREAGYRTGAFGKMHFNSQLLHGFEVHRAPRAFGDIFTRQRGASPLPAGIEILPRWRPFRVHARTWLNADTRPLGRYDSEMRASWYTNEAIAFLRAHRDEPVFAVVSYHQPHSPYYFPVEFAGRIDSATLDVPAIGPEDVPQIPKIFADLTYREKQGIKASYHTAVEYLDKKIGELLNAVDEMDSPRKTLIIYLGDHGYHLGEHGRFEKHCFYEDAVRAPLVMNSPGLIPSRRSSDALVEFVDLVPTVLDYAGLPARDDRPGRDLQGRSLKPLIEGRVQNVRDHVFSEYQPTGEAMVLNRRYKLVYRTASNLTHWMGYEPLIAPEGRVIKLYDTLADPREYRNRANEPEMKAVVDEIIGRLESWYRQVPLKNETPPEGLKGMAFLDWAIPPRPPTQSAPAN